MAARRGQKDAANNIGLFPEFAWCWPVNRRIIYNRASVDAKGIPWDRKDWVVYFKGEEKDGKYVSRKWMGDVPDGGWYPMQNPDGSWRDDTKYPFIMRKHGHAQIFGPGRADGPFPEHYEPLECPVEKNYLNPQMVNPTAAVYSTEADAHATCDPRFPYVGTTYRVSEHWQTGLMTRTQSWLMELQPQMFVELSEELARLKGIRNGERVNVKSARGQGGVQRHCHQTVQALHDRRPDGSPGGHSLALWLAMAVNRQGGQRQPAHAVGRRSQHPDSGNQGIHGQRG
jgi:formate dehydrogenase major subunit